MVRPLMNALLLCDQVYIDGRTGKKVIAGTFNHISANEFPSEFSTRKCAFLSLTDFRGELSITLRFVDLRGNDTLVEMQGIKVRAESPLETVEVVVQIPKLPFPHPGVYAFEAHVEDTMMGFLRISVEQGEASGDAQKMSGDE